MPVRKVGPNSYQWGTSGKVYTGKDAKAKAERQGRAAYASGYREAESYKPPASAVANAKRGLALRKEYGRGGLSPSEAKSQGIDSGVTRARKIASGKVSRHDVRRMSAFNRHRKNYRPEKKMPDGGPTAGTIAWLLWGGTSGVNWAKKKSASMNAESEERYGKDYMVPADIHRILESAVHLQQLQESHEGSYPEWWKSKLSVVASQLDNLTDVLDYKVDHPEEFDAEDYNSFTDELQSLIDKYGVLQSYYTTFGDNLMDVSFSFQPHDPYFDDVDFDAENWGGDPEGPLAKALARAREKLSQPRKPLRITSLPHPDQKTLKDFEADVITKHKPYPLVYARKSPFWGRTRLFCWKCGDLDHHYSNCKSTQKYTDALSRKKDMLKAVNAAIKVYSTHPGPFSDSDVKDLKELRRMIKNNHFGIARHYFDSLDTAVRDNIGYETEISFEADWQDLPRDRMGRWRKPVDSESINRLTESLSSDVPSISELLTMYGGDTPTNRFRLYQDLQTLSIAQMDAALPDDSIVEFDEADLSWMTPEEYYQYVLEEPLNISDDIEDDTQTVEFQDRLVRYTAMTMTPTEVDDLLEQNLKNVVADLFAPDSEDTEAEIAFLLAVKRYQEFSDRYAAESD